MLLLSRRRRLNKSMANITRYILESADNTNLSRFLSEAPWRKDEVNRRRIRFMLQQTTPHRQRRRESVVAIDDTLCEHVGSLFDYVDRHTTTAMAPITWPITRSPACMSVSPCAFPWACASIAVMRS